MHRVLLGVVGSALIATVAVAQALQTALPQGYLGADKPDILATLTPPPKAGSPRAEADRKMFRATRSLQGTPRWDLAVSDNSASYLTLYRCALGVEISAEKTPKLLTLIRRVGRDASDMGNGAKAALNHPRPFLIDKGPTCIPKTDPSLQNPDYPSGHSTIGWTFGLLLAELAPDRAQPILVRARAFGESRMVCGVHNMSAVDAGRMTAQIALTAEHGSPAFRRDLEEARTELAAVRAATPAPDAAACAKEAALLVSLE
jgi:acid phosphatase (class A)